MCSSLLFAGQHSHGSISRYSNAISFMATELTFQLLLWQENFVLTWHDNMMAEQSETKPTAVPPLVFWYSKYEKHVLIPGLILSVLQEQHWDKAIPDYSSTLHRVDHMTCLPHHNLNNLFKCDHKLQNKRMMIIITVMFQQHNSSIHNYSVVKKMADISGLCYAHCWPPQAPIMNLTQNMCNAANKTMQQNRSVHPTRNSGTVWTLVSCAWDK